MRHSLHSHIIYLENRIQSLRDSLTKSRVNREELEELERQISTAELALERYREAYALELSVDDPDSPDSSDTETNGGRGERGGLSSDHKQGGACSITARARKGARVRMLPGPTACRRHASSPDR